MKKTLYLIFSLTFICHAAPAQAQESSSFFLPHFEEDFDSLTPTEHTEHDGYTIDRYDLEGYSGSFYIDFASEKLREHGLVSLYSRHLWILDLKTKEITKTKFIPSFRSTTGDSPRSIRGVYTSQWIGNDMVVTDDEGGIFLYNPVTQASEQIMDPEITGVTVEDFYWPYGSPIRVINDQIFFSSFGGVARTYDRAEEPIYHWLRDTNTIEQIYELPEIDAPADDNTLPVGMSVYDYRVKSAPYVALSGSLGSEHFVGQIDRGIYIVDQAGNLTRIDTTRHSALAADTNFRVQRRSLYIPRTIQDEYIVWIGEEGFSVATVDVDNLVPTGLLDIPIGVPFRSESDPAVYFRHPTPRLAIRKFLSAEDYFNASQDYAFDHVITLSDELIKEYKTEEFYFDLNVGNVWTKGDEPDWILRNLDWILSFNDPIIYHP